MAGRYSQFGRARSLSDLKNRSEKIAEREQNLIIFSAIVFPIAEKISKLWAAQVFLQPIPFKSDRLLGRDGGCGKARFLSKLRTL